MHVIWLSVMNQVLSLKDLKLILADLYEVCDKWYGIGLELDLSVDYLEDLEATYSVDNSTCLRKVLVEWLRSKQATWASLIKVLDSDVVKGSPLAKVLQKKYCSSSAGKPTAKSTSKDNRSITRASKTSPPFHLETSSCNFKQAAKRVKKSSDLLSPKKSKVDVEVPETFLPSDFVTVPPPNRLCVKCKCVPRVPIVSKCCNLLYCEPCSNSLGNTRCHKHKEMLQYIIDVELQRKLVRLRRRCINRSNGCKWKGNGRELIQHLQSDCSQTGCLSNSTNSEESSTDNLATASAMPSVLFTEPSLKEIEEVVVEEFPEGQIAVTTESVGHTTSERISNQNSTIFSSSPQPLRMQQSKWMRESCYLLKTPPLNFAMENVSEYINSDEAWLSDDFFSHQIGYKICLAVRIESSSEVNGSLNVMFGMTSAEGTHSSYLSYPCSGFATVAILNPYKNCDHKVSELVFTLEKPVLNSYREIVSDVVYVPPHFITQNDCIFFQVAKIDMDKTKHKLWLLDASLVEDQELQYESGESSE